AQSPSKAYDMAMARWAAAFAAGVAAESMRRWKIARASVVRPSVSRRLAWRMGESWAPETPPWASDGSAAAGRAAATSSVQVTARNRVVALTVTSSGGALPAAGPWEAVVPRSIMALRAGGRQSMAGRMSPLAAF